MNHPISKKILFCLIVYSFISILSIIGVIYSLKSKLNFLQKEEFTLKAQYSEDYRKSQNISRLKQKIVQLQSHSSFLSSQYFNAPAITHFIAASCQSHQIQLKNFQLKPSSYSFFVKMELRGLPSDLISLLIQWMTYFSGMSIQSLQWITNAHLSDTMIHFAFIF